MFHLIIYINPTSVCFLKKLPHHFLKKLKAFHHMAFFFFFPILGSPRVGRKHKLVTAGSESTLLFFFHEQISSIPNVEASWAGGGET